MKRTLLLLLAVLIMSTNVSAWQWYMEGEETAVILDHEMTEAMQNHIQRLDWITKIDIRDSLTYVWLDEHMGRIFEPTAKVKTFVDASDFFTGYEAQRTANIERLAMQGVIMPFCMRDLFTGQVVGYYSANERIIALVEDPLCY